MTIGMFADILSIIIGGLLGAVGGKLLPDKQKEALTPTFAVATFGMGILSIVKMANLPVVILALILGVIIGTGCNLETHLRHAGEWCAKVIVRGGPTDPAARTRNLELFSIAVILFCSGPTGIYGAIRASITGDNALLFSKCVLDIFTAFAFAASAGVIISMLAVPVFCLYLFLSLISGSIEPLLTPEMLADFSGCGGLLILATGFRMAEIRMFHVTDMLPALLLVMPLSYLWNHLPL